MDNNLYMAHMFFQPYCTALLLAAEAPLLAKPWPTVHNINKRHQLVRKVQVRYPDVNTVHCEYYINLGSDARTFVGIIACPTQIQQLHGLSN